MQEQIDQGLRILSKKQPSRWTSRTYYCILLGQQPCHLFGQLGEVHFITYSRYQYREMPRSMSSLYLVWRCVKSRRARESEEYVEPQRSMICTPNTLIHLITKLTGLTPQSCGSCFTGWTMATMNVGHWESSREILDCQDHSSPESLHKISWTRVYQRVPLMLSWLANLVTHFEGVVQSWLCHYKSNDLQPLSYDHYSPNSIKHKSSFAQFPDYWLDFPIHTHPHSHKYPWQTNRALKFSTKRVTIPSFCSLPALRLCLDCYFSFACHYPISFV